MKFNYTITTTTKSCPSCGYILKLKRHNDGWDFIICLFFCPFILIYAIYLFASRILSEHILPAYIPKVGKSYMICPKRGQKISTEKKEYESLDAIEKLCYDNRGLIRIAYFCGGTMLLSLPICFFRLSKNRTDSIIGTIANVIFVICLMIIISIIVYWKYLIKIEAKKIDEVSNNTINSVSEFSNFSTQQEGLSNLLNYSNMNFNFTESDLENIKSDVKFHIKENLPKFFMQFKEKNDNMALKDIAFTFIHMYARQDKLLFITKDKAFPIVNTPFGRYLPIYTDKKYVNNLIGNRYIEEETKSVFEMFYLLNSTNKCEGIVFNYGTDSMVLLPKISIDNIGFDIVFDVPWKKG